ncbi:hypothetical protein [Fangia hongkongensis]|uniref:hypothetical protein n=1 Tax=Fangia hongkongensis TaxID=270495 RepID=UPI00037FF3FB|nr:hypothetical protein [Fangia hongkongensis]
MITKESLEHIDNFNAGIVDQKVRIDTQPKKRPEIPRSDVFYQSICRETYGYYIKTFPPIPYQEASNYGVMKKRFLLPDKLLYSNSKFLECEKMLKEIINKVYFE